MKKSKKLAFATIASSVLLSATTAYGVTKATVNDVFIPSGEQTNGFVNTTSRGLAGQPDFTQVAEHTINSVVSIKNYANARQQQFQDWGGGFDPFEFFFGPGMGQQRKQQQPKQRSEGKPQLRGSGSGVIISADGYIVTNNHVVAGAEKLKVYLQDGTEYEAELIGTDSYTDLAVIKIAAENLPAAVLGSSNESMVGDTVYAIGNPLGVLATSVSKGIVSGLDREITLDNKQMTLMQVNASVNPGNSGGGLFNADGELIGIVNSKASGNNVEGIGFAIPMDTAKPVISDLMDHGYVTGRPYIGIVMQNVTFSTGGYGFFGGGYTTHPQIYSIEAGSSAEKAGLKVNDIILAFDGETVNSSSDISAKLYGYKVGDMVTITVQRGSAMIDVTLTLGDRAS